MLKTIIVDDEMLVRLGFKTYIQSNSSEFEVVGTFSNGIEALEFCEKIVPDIALIDIKMPDMDGIELTKALRQKFSDMLIIILSCHDDFKYVKAAFMLGADDYILKHEVDGEELINILNNAKLKRRKMNDCLINTNNGLVNRKKEIFGHLCEKANKLDYQGILQWKNINNLNMADYYAILSIAIDKKYKESGQIIPVTITNENISNVVSEIIRKYGGGETWQDEDKNNLICFINLPKKMYAEEFKEKIREIAIDIQKSINNYYNEFVSIGISNPQYTLANIYAAQSQAQKACDYRFYHGSECLVFYEDYKGNEDNYDNPEKARKSIIFDFDNLNNLKDCIERIQLYFQDARKNLDIKPLELKKEIDLYIHYILGNLKKYFDLQIEDIIDGGVLGITQRIMEIDRISILESWVISSLNRIEETIKERAGTSNIINEILDFIGENYNNEKLTLKFISKEFHISTNYLCQLFKKETGMNFVDYVTSLRIKKAKDLLAKTDYTTEYIAEKTGFNSANYFNRVFKKHTGMRVGEYRKKVKRYKIYNNS